MNDRQPSAASNPGSLLHDIFAMTESLPGGDRSPRSLGLLRSLHERLSNPAFVAQMTGVFFRAKRVALADANKTEFTRFPK